MENMKAMENIAKCYSEIINILAKYECGLIIEDDDIKIICSVFDEERNMNVSASRYYDSKDFDFFNW